MTYWTGFSHFSTHKWQHFFLFARFPLDWGAPLGEYFIYIMDTDNRVAPPILFVYWFGLQNLRRHMCCRAKKNL